MAPWHAQLLGGWGLMGPPGVPWLPAGPLLHGDNGAGWGAAGLLLYHRCYGAAQCLWEGVENEAQRGTGVRGCRWGCVGYPEGQGQEVRDGSVPPSILRRWAQISFFPLHCSRSPAHGKAACRSLWSLARSSSCTVVFSISRGVARRMERKSWDALALLGVLGQAGGSSAEGLMVPSGLCAEVVSGEEGSVPGVAVGLCGVIEVSGDVSVVSVETPGLVSVVLPSGGLGLGVLLGNTVLVMEVVVVSATVVEGSGGAAVCAEVRGALLVPGAVLGIAGVGVSVPGLEAGVGAAVLSSDTGGAVGVGTVAPTAVVPSASFDPARLSSRNRGSRPLRAAMSREAGANASWLAQL